MKLSLASYDWALTHLVLEGDTDLFPTPFEISAIRDRWGDLRDQFANLDLSTYAWRGCRRFVVPKKMLSFRIATQLDPFDSLILAALIYDYGPALESIRIPVSEGSIFSNRFMPDSSGRMYSTSTNWHGFWQASLNLAQAGGCSFVVIADVADFYNQIYHHVLERQFQAAGFPEPTQKVFKRFLQKLTDKVSRGVPVGPHAAHILAESALDPTDRSLRSHGYTFCRYVDDYHIFVRDEESASGALYDLAQILDTQQRLIIQNEKTQVMPAAAFVELAQSMLIDRPVDDQEKRILRLINSKTGGDPYREVTLSSLTSEELDLLDQPILERLLDHYLGSIKVDYPRLSWVLRRLTQVGAPGAVEFILQRISKLSPVLGPVARYFMAAVPNFTGNKHQLGESVVQALDLPAVRRSHYLQAVLLDVLASLPEMDHVDSVTARYATSDPLVRREILRVAGTGGRGDWLRDRKAEFETMDPWVRRAFIQASTALPREECKFWFEGVRDRMTAMEKTVAHAAFAPDTLRLGNIQVSS